MSGIFISFEGIDGAGKSTHIHALADALRSQDRALKLTREPGGTALAEQLRNMVLNDSMDPMTEALLVFAARRDHVQRVILPALARGEVVLCDRFTDATFAYQGGGRGFEWQVLQQLEHWVQHDGQSGLLQPHTTVWFDLPPAVAAERLAGARVPDKFESQPIAFFESVAAGYARRQSEDPARFVRINAHQAPAAVWQDVQAALRARGVLPS
ncbi:MAG: dTMP kinase [Curvibacter sp.]|nr:MAG: dTMP kinase [Curvibacter sp.]